MVSYSCKNEQQLNYSTSVQTTSSSKLHAYKAVTIVKSNRLELIHLLYSIYKQLANLLVSYSPKLNHSQVIACLAEIQLADLVEVCLSQPAGEQSGLAPLVHV